MKLMLKPMSDQQKLTVVSALIRIGLAGVFLYAAEEALRNPSAWIGFVPSFTNKFVDAKLALDSLSVAQLGLVIWLMSGRFIKLAAVASIGLLAGIVLFDPGAILITFRDFGLIFAAMALIVIDLPKK
jgi:hypothetical protein